MIADLGLRIAECDFQIGDWDSSDFGFGIADCGLKTTIVILTFRLRDRKNGE